MNRIESPPARVVYERNGQGTTKRLPEGFVGMVRKARILGDQGLQISLLVPRHARREARNHEPACPARQRPTSSVSDRLQNPFVAHEVLSSLHVLHKRQHRYSSLTSIFQTLPLVPPNFQYLPTGKQFANEPPLLLLPPPPPPRNPPSPQRTAAELPVEQIACGYPVIAPSPSPRPCLSLKPKQKSERANTDVLGLTFLAMAVSMGARMDASSTCPRRA